MIFLSAGHHLADPGASGNGYIERDLAIELRDLIASELRLLGASFILDKDVETLAEYLQRIQTGSGSVVFEVHWNAATPSATGTEMFIPDGRRIPDCRPMAQEIASFYASAMRIKSRGVKTASQSNRGKLGIMAESGIVVLAEVCFISNRDDMAAYQAAKNLIANGTAKILVKYDKMYS
jgi:N-acetylmuramoyl-L-alanine amidase